ncbi:alpha/beta fold hydrolase [Candidatus Halobonum tyrrellensis]|uniref:Hydrolase or acyltransferase of alpha/beta superfamily protein n=1 Tax=Candidatus Halobonum tyrrellensis G22 TaxID=1324957 RepID=V4IVG4_9EURY|nr:alpha/beta hydrolase [Candidatus Halobonum tyrrellensis]ESP87192.1 hydrolase or acyltransferase of alpha/beta superfamily protein [Candidatus Halobonum tyrrellensis G22]
MSGDRRVAYAEYGAPDGEPVILLHGTPGSRLLGALFDGDARRRGVRLLVPDRPGYGRSSPWPDRTLADAGTTVGAVLDDAGVRRAGVVGFSGGGPHALALAATRRDLVDGVDVVAGAVPPSLRSTRPLAVRLAETLAATTPRLLAGAARGGGRVAKRAPASFVVSQYTTPEGRAAVSDRVAELARREFVEAFAHTARGFVTETRLLAQEWTVDPADVDRRVRLWHGADDANVPVADARRLADRLPDGRLTVVDGADHLGALLRQVPELLGRYGSAAEG